MANGPHSEIKNIWIQSQYHIAPSIYVRHDPGSSWLTLLVVLYCYNKVLYYFGCWWGGGGLVSLDIIIGKGLVWWWWCWGNLWATPTWNSFWILRWLVINGGVLMTSLFLSPQPQHHHHHHNHAPMHQHHAQNQCMAQLEHQPQPQSDPTWHVPISYTLYCCYVKLTLRVKTSIHVVSLV